jgi:hypothetical protein
MIFVKLNPDNSMIVQPYENQKFKINNNIYRVLSITFVGSNITSFHSTMGLFTIHLNDWVHQRSFLFENKVIVAQWI